MYNTFWGVQQRTHLFFRRKKKSHNNVIHFKSKLLSVFIFSVSDSSCSYALYIPSSFCGHITFFHVVFSPSLASQTHLENKVINCVTGISDFVKKKNSFTNSFQCSMRFRVNTVWILCVNGTETK